MVSQFKILKIMSSIFTPDFSFSDTLGLLNLFQELSGGKFDGELFSAPIPQSAPAEIPRIILNSKDKARKLEVSLERTNIVFQQLADLSIPPPETRDFADSVGGVFKAYKKKTSIRVQRLALVTERYIEMPEEPPPQFIAAKYCKKQYLKAPFNNPKAFELHSLKTYEWNGFHINSWVRLKSATLSDPAQTPVFLVINDLNTLGKEFAESESFGEQDIARFFKNAPNHIEEILGLYF
jgi:hypothetical protein